MREVYDKFRLWMYTRDIKEGEGSKLVSYHIFLNLYDVYPEICIELVKRGVLSEIGYWKDLYLIWGIINKLDLKDIDKYKKYNMLILAFRDTILTQRLKDLRHLNSMSSKKLGDYKNEELREYLRGLRLRPSISNVGKYCVREKSILNKELYWYNTNLLKESHVSFMIRWGLKEKKCGGLKDYPIEKSVPSKSKKVYRELNSKLIVCLEVPEMLLCDKRYSMIDKESMRLEFKKKNVKCLLKHNLIEKKDKVKKVKYSYDDLVILNYFEKLDNIIKELIP